MQINNHHVGRGHGVDSKPIRQLAEVNATVQKGLAAAEDTGWSLLPTIFCVFGSGLLSAVILKIVFERKW